MKFQVPDLLSNGCGGFYINKHYDPVFIFWMVISTSYVVYHHIMPDLSGHLKGEIHNKQKSKCINQDDVEILSDYKILELLTCNIIHKRNIIKQTIYDSFYRKYYYKKADKI